MTEWLNERMINKIGPLLQYWLDTESFYCAVWSTLTVCWLVWPAAWQAWIWPISSATNISFTCNDSSQLGPATPLVAAPPRPPHWPNTGGGAPVRSSSLAVGVGVDTWHIYRFSAQLSPAPGPGPGHPQLAARHPPHPHCRARRPIWIIFLCWVILTS